MARTIQVTIIALAILASASVCEAQIQILIDNASPGDTIVLPDGVYTGPGNIELDFLGKDIVLVSQNGPASCIIDCAGAGRAFHFQNGETNAARVDGITIRNGSATTFGPGGNRGAGIRCAGSSPSIRNCIIENCSLDPVAFGEGAGMQFASSDANVRRCTIRNNDAGPFGIGGGAFATGGSLVRFRSCCFTDNSAVIGGGFHTDASSTDPILENCTVAGNTASSAGGGVSTSSFGGSVTLYNSIVWGNVATGLPTSSDIHNQSGGITATWSDIRGGFPGTGNINANPRFVSASTGDYHLRRNSPAINMGDPAFTGGGKDIDGEQRVWIRVDMGCDEVLPAPIPPVL